MTENEIGKIIVNTAIQLHQKIGPGLLENVYEVILAKLRADQGLKIKRQTKVPVTFEGMKFDEGYRADLIVEGKVIVELKSVERNSPVHPKQLLTHLRMSDKKLGFVLNFGMELMKHGIQRVINGKLEPEIPAVQ